MGRGLTGYHRSGLLVASDTFLDDVTLLFAHYTAPPYRSYATPGNNSHRPVAAQWPTGYYLSLTPTCRTSRSPLFAPQPSTDPQ